MPKCRCKPFYVVALYQPTPSFHHERDLLLIHLFWWDELYGDFNGTPTFLIFARTGRSFKFRCGRMMYAAWSNRSARRFDAIQYTCNLFNLNGFANISWSTKSISLMKIGSYLTFVVRIQRRVSHRLTYVFNYRLFNYSHRMICRRNRIDGRSLYNTYKIC